MHANRYFPPVSIAIPRDSSLLVAVVRDEEVVGSNPATPTAKSQVEGTNSAFRSKAFFDFGPQ